MAEYDIQSLLSSYQTKHLIRNNSEQVAIDTLNGKKLGLYFSASCSRPCQKFTPYLVDVYNEIAAIGDFEIVFISNDDDEESFARYYSKMPWLAIPFSDIKTRWALPSSFKVCGLPHLVFLDENGKVLSDCGVKITEDYGAEAYPFTPERVKQIKELEEEARTNQTLKSILESQLIITSTGEKVSVTDLEGKTVGLYFVVSTFRGLTFKESSDFTRTLVKMYNELKAKEVEFEIVMIPLNDNEEPFPKELGTVPWLSLPLKGKNGEKLVRHFMVSTLPTLVIIGPDGRTRHLNAAEAIEEYGVDAYPFTHDTFVELETRQHATQTLDSVLVRKELDYLLRKDGSKIFVSELAGKYILLYFASRRCVACCGFTPKLVEAFEQIKEKHEDFEVIFISSDRNVASYKNCYSGMPWLSLPFNDKRTRSLTRHFRVNWTPLVAALGPTGKTITTEARGLIMRYGAYAFPFTDERVAEMAKEWPNKVKNKLHQGHELALTRSRWYGCGGCDEGGWVWAYKCEACKVDFHPECVVKDSDGKKEVDEAANEGENKKRKEQTMYGRVSLV